MGISCHLDVELYLLKCTYICIPYVTLCFIMSHFLKRWYSPYFSEFITLLWLVSVLKFNICSDMSKKRFGCLPFHLRAATEQNQRLQDMWAPIKILTGTRTSWDVFWTEQLHLICANCILSITTCTFEYGKVLYFRMWKSCYIDAHRIKHFEALMSCNFDG